MEQNGRSSPDLMILDAPSPTTAINTNQLLKDMPDEPTAPRRNSNDDSDTTLPRKRPAVMANTGDIERSSPSSTRHPIETPTHTSDTSALDDTSTDESDRTIGTPGTLTASPSKTMPLRHGKHDSAVVSPIKGDRQKGTRTESPISIHSSPSHDDQSPQSTSPEAGSPLIEAVESADEADAIADQIRFLGPNIAEIQTSEAAEDTRRDYGNTLDIIYNGLGGDEKTVLNTLDELKGIFSNQPSPYMEIKATADVLLRINQEMNQDLEQWARILAHSRVFPDNLQSIIFSLLKRTTLFAGDFTENALGINGEIEICNLFTEYIHNMNIMIRIDMARLESSGDEDIRLYSRKYIFVTQKFCQKADFHTIIGNDFWSALSGIYKAFTGLNGFTDLLDRFLSVLFTKVPKQPKLFQVITDVLTLDNYLFILANHLDRLHDNTRLQTELARRLAPGFITTQTRLLELLKSHVSVLDLNMFLTQLDNLKTLGVNLYNHTSCPMLSAHLRDRTAMYIKDPLKCLPDHRPLLVENMILFPVYFQMLSTSRMDFRLNGLTRMTALLLDFWRNWGSALLHSTSSPLTYLTEFILQNKVVEYLLGPESHFELIRRCYNVPSFLFVSHEMTAEVMDAMWQPVLSNKDPRVVNAVLVMCQEMTMNMYPDHLDDLCERICKIPYESVDGQVLELITRAVDKLRKSCNDLTKPAPYNMLIRLIRHASENDENSRTDEHVATAHLFELANSQLRILADIGPGYEERKTIYDECVKDFRDKNTSVTGSATVIYCFLSRRMTSLQSDDLMWNDTDYLITEAKLPALMVEELETFVKSHRGTDSEGRMRKLRSRLDLLYFFLQHSPECLAVEQHSTLWACLVGDDAYGADERNLGFEFYLRFIDNVVPYRTMLDCIFHDLFPRLDSKCFSYGVLEFCKRAMGYLTQKAQSASTAMTLEDEPEPSIIQIHGVEQLWRIILTADDEILAEEATATFIGTYLDNHIITSGGPDVIKATHLQIVDRCINQILATSKQWIVSPEERKDESRDALIRTFVRSIELIHSLVLGLRCRPAYFSLRRRPEKIQIKGDPYILRFRIDFDQAVKTLEIGTLNTGAELYDQFRGYAGQIRKVMQRGRDLKLEENPAKPISELSCTKDDLVQIYSTNPQQRADEQPKIYSCDVVEDEIMKHHTELHTLLDLPSQLAGKAWSFLSIFPPDENIKKQIMDPDVPWAELYPPSKPFKTHYSMHTLWAVAQTPELLSTYIGISLPKLTKAFVASASGDVPVDDMAGVGMRLMMLSLMKHGLNQAVPVETYKAVFEDPTAIVTCLLNTIEQFLSATGNTQIQLSAGEVVASAVYVLFECAKIDATVWSLFQEKIDKDWVYRLLVKDERELVRNSLSQAIMLLCSDSEVEAAGMKRTFACEKKEYASFIWPILCALVSLEDHIWPVPSANCRQLFQTTFHTFRFVAQVDAESETPLLDLPMLFDTWITRLCTYPFVEVVGRPVENSVIQGYTHLLRSCVLVMNQRDISVDGTKYFIDVWTKLLFPEFEESATQATIPVLHDNTRTELYRLLLDLVDGPRTLMKLIFMNLALFGGKDDQLLEISVAERDRWLVSSAGKSGLSNLSNTCYLNSLLTQLFMNERFREFILSLDVPKTEETKAMYNLRILFARMQNGYQKALEPKDLVDSLRDFAGDPIDPTVQMDVDEFFNLLFDRLENEMTDEQLKAKFKSVFGGQLVQQVKSKECSHISEKEEAFSAIQCDIKGKSTLLESLKAYVEGEVMEGDNKYRCSKCDKLVDAVKRTCLKQIPDNLIFHLKRFDFDLQTMNRSKINDYFEFPNTIDMSPFKLDYLTAAEENQPTRMPPDEFELVGVLVHTGTAESGHYYSYIKDRFFRADTPSWLEFNDSEVSAFDPLSIAAACYGGCDGAMANGYPLSKAFSAYMLFYQRRQTSATNNLPASSNISVTEQGDLELVEGIAHDNHEMIKRYCMFGDNYMTFLRELFEGAYKLCHETEHEQVFTKRHVQLIMDLALRAFQQICSKFKECLEWSNFQLAITNAVVADETCCRRFLDWASSESTIRSMILENLHPNVRQQFGRMVLTALARLKDTNPVAYGITPDVSPTKRNNSYLFNFLRGMSTSWSGLQWAYRPWNDFFFLLGKLSNEGPNEIDYILKAEILLKILQTFMAQHMTAEDLSLNDLSYFPRLLQKPRNATARPVELLTTLFSRVSPFVEPCLNEDHRDTLRDQDYLPLTQREQSYIFYMKDNSLVFFSTLLEQLSCVTPTADLITQIISSGPPHHRFLDSLKDSLISAISIEPADDAAPHLRCLRAFVEATTCDEYIAEIINKVASEVGTIGMNGGQEHYEFFLYLADSEAAKDTYSNIMKYIITNVPLWAPALVLYTDESVRQKTCNLLDSLLFDEARTDERWIGEIINASQELWDAGITFVKTKIGHLGPIDERSFLQLHTVLSQCTKFLDDSQEEVQAKMADLKAFLEQDRDEEEIGINSGDEWPNSDLDSDGAVDVEDGFRP